MKYESYTFEDFVADQEFSHWVRTGSEESNLFWQQYMEAHPNQRQEILLAKEFLQSLQFKMLEATNAEYKEILNKLLTARTATTKPTTFKNINRLPVRMHTMSRIIRYAASIALLAFFTYIFWRVSTEQSMQEPVAENIIAKKTGPGVKTQLKLPDGTLVWLNVESTLTFNKPFGDGNRRIELTGEAYFEVKSDPSRPFTVVTDKGIVNVFGTTFNVKAYPSENSFSVALLEGSLSINNQTEENGDPFLLKPGQRAIINNNMHQPLISEMSYERDMSWKDGVLYFEKSNQEEIFTRLERWYDVKFKYSDVPKEKWNYSGYFDNMSLELVLQRLSFTENFRYEINGKEVRITFNVDS